MLQSSKGLRAVCIFDPAIARVVPQEELIMYARSRDMASIERYITKAEPPTMYHFRRLTRSVMDRHVDTQPSDEGKAVAAFQFGIVAVDNKREMDGTRIPWKPTGNTATPDGDIATMTAKEVDLFSRAEQIEIGTVIWNTAFLPQWAGLGPAYPVPPTSLALWARLDLPSAETSQSTAPQNSSKPCGSDSAAPVQTSPAPESGVSESEKATVVPAAASK